MVTGSRRGFAYLTQYHFSIIPCCSRMRTVQIQRWGDRYRLVYFRGGLPYGRRNDTRDEAGRERPDDDSNELGALRYENNVSRARSRLQGYAACNPWDWFFTGTIDAAKADRYSLPLYRRRLGQWLSNFNRKYGCKLAYIIVPEQHKNGAWHCHGLLRGVPSEAISRNAHGHNTLLDYNRRFGFCSLDPIRDHRRVSSYITKYISKDMSAAALDAGARLFYSSHGLAEPERVFSVSVTAEAVADYENEWVGLSWVEPDSELGLMISRAEGSTYFKQQLAEELSKKTDSEKLSKILDGKMERAMNASQAIIDFLNGAAAP